MIQRNLTGSESQARAVETVPYAGVQPVDLVGISTAGQWFRKTNGGIPMNCNEAIMALELETLKSMKEKLAKQKKDVQGRKKQLTDGRNVLRLK